MGAGEGSEEEWKSGVEEEGAGEGSGAEWKTVVEEEGAGALGEEI